MNSLHLLNDIPSSAWITNLDKTSLRIWLTRERIRHAKEIKVPELLMSTPYNSEVNPDNPPPDFVDLSSGSNCLIFSYAILQHNWFSPPILWPMELWDDEKYTERVHEEYRAWDILLLWNDASNAFWWHAAVSLGWDRLIHLSRKVGIPEITTYQELIERGSYRYLLWAKRLK
jgi:hypothetical protein